MNTLGLCILLFIFMSSLDSNPTPKPKRFVTKMIYYNSVHSPYFKPNASMEDRMKDEMEIFSERLAYLKILTQGNISSEKIESRLITGGPPRLFFLILYVGEPRTQQLVVMDTGSSLFWIHCKPCRGCNKLLVPLYDPEESATFVDDVSCDSSYCINSGTRNMCGSLEECIYTIQYVSGFDQGTLCNERFVTTDGELLDNVVFGCSKTAVINNRIVTQYNGILGLGAGEISLISQKGYNKFSYCIGDLYDEQNDYNKLIIGEPLVNSIYSTPFIVDGYHYYVNLERISVGDKLLDINPKELRRSTVDQTGGAIVDSGSTFNYLQPAAYKKLEGEIIRLMSARNWVRSNYTGKENKLDLCYRGMMATVHNFPKVTFHFAQGAKIELSTKNLFQQYSLDDFCLDVGNTEDVGLSSSLIGVRLQQFSYIAYDLVNMRVSFQSVDCKKIG